MSVDNHIWWQYKCIPVHVKLVFILIPGAVLLSLRICRNPLLVSDREVSAAIKNGELYRTVDLFSQSIHGHYGKFALKISRSRCGIQD